MEIIVLESDSDQDTIVSGYSQECSGNVTSWHLLCFMELGHESSTISLLFTARWQVVRRRPDPNRFTPAVYRAHYCTAKLHFQKVDPCVLVFHGLIISAIPV